MIFDLLTVVKISKKEKDVPWYMVIFNFFQIRDHRPKKPQKNYYVEIFFVKFSFIYQRQNNFLKIWVVLVDDLNAAIETLKNVMIAP